jgi:hypothetical protein
VALRTIHRILLTSLAFLFSAIRCLRVFRCTILMAARAGRSRRERSYGRVLPGQPLGVDPHREIGRVRKPRALASSNVAEARTSTSYEIKS